MINDNRITLVHINVLQNYNCLKLFDLLSSINRSTNCSNSNNWTRYTSFQLRGQNSWRALRQKESTFFHFNFVISSLRSLVWLDQRTTVSFDVSFGQGWRNGTNFDIFSSSSQSEKNFSLNLCLWNHLEMVNSRKCEHIGKPKLAWFFRYSILSSI